MSESSLVFRKELQDHEIYVGGSCQLVCEFSKPVKVKWLFQGKKINTSQEVKKEHHLIITNASVKEDGRYNCIAKHDNLQLNTSCCLSVKDETTMDMAQLQKEVRKLQENLSTQTKMVKEKEKEKNAFAEKLLQLREDHEKTKKDLEAAKEKISLLNREIQELKSSITRLEETIKTHIKELEKREKQIQDQSNQMKEFLQYQKGKEIKLDEFMKEFEDLKGVSRTFSSCANNMEQIVRDQVEAKQKIHELETEKCEANNIIRDLTEKHSDVEKKLETAIAEKNIAIQCQMTAESEKAVVVEQRDAETKLNRGLEAQIKDLPKEETTGCMPFLCSK